MTMKLKILLCAAVAVVSTVLPAQAKVDRGTNGLLDTLNNHGFVISVDSDDCPTDGSILGSYRSQGLMYREMLLCPNGTVDAIDHSTVRHEMTHVLQHCVNIQRGTDRDTPIVNDDEQLAKLVNTYVPSDVVTFIKNTYPQNRWKVEFEAQYAELVYTADELVEMFYELECQHLFRK